MSGIYGFDYRFHEKGFFDIKIYQKEQNLYAYIPQNTLSKIMC